MFDVICIDATGTNYLIEGNKYTCMGESKFWPGEIQIKELGISSTGHYRSAYAWRFRKIDDTYAEQVLEEIAQKVREEELVNA